MYVCLVTQCSFDVFISMSSSVTGSGIVISGRRLWPRIRVGVCHWSIVGTSFTTIHGSRSVGPSRTEINALSRTCQWIHLCPLSCSLYSITMLCMHLPIVYYSYSWSWRRAGWRGCWRCGACSSRTSQPEKVECTISRHIHMRQKSVSWLVRCPNIRDCYKDVLLFEVLPFQDVLIGRGLLISRCPN